MIINEKEYLHSDITENIIGVCFVVVKELRAGFLENVYKNALYISLHQKGLNVATEVPFEIIFRNQKIGKYIADLIVNNEVIIELKCCKTLLPEHQAQLINYLKASGLSVGLLINFGNQKLEFKRVYNPEKFVGRRNYTVSSLLSH